jgi:CheY-like chemotaxis protein
MSNHIAKPPLEVSNRAEGDPDEREQLEPTSPLRTSLIPVVHDTSEKNSSDTGVLFLSELRVEGIDKHDDQDSSLTKDEKKLDTKRETDAKKNDAADINTILIVEDTVELAEVIQATIEGMGLKAVFETHGRNGIERLKQLRPQLMLMDIGLPDISGWKMLDLIKEAYVDNETTMPTIIVISAYGDPANRLIGKLQNIHSYLLKPFTPDEVERVVGMALRGERPPEPKLGGETSSTK